MARGGKYQGFGTLRPQFGGTGGTFNVEGYRPVLGCQYGPSGGLAAPSKTCIRVVRGLQEGLADGIWVAVRIMVPFGVP